VANLKPDMCTTTALNPIARPGFWEFMGGVTRSLSISYVRAVPIGTTVRIKSVVMQAGRQMALIQGTMKSVDGKIVSLLRRLCDYVGFSAYGTRRTVPVSTIKSTRHRSQTTSVLQ
jgi:hypothetical protein